uniref:Divalent cation tolerance protein n=1 Tax=Candidatus Kentrum sp. FW TaxID=2126338 RepID=A0A450TWK9_9GAMM|nr:MAG: divalent cation tolerance protein [Candidatus Kentron sp. FW]
MKTTSGTPYRIVFCTCPTPDVARTIARALVEARLAACVNIVPGIQSVYRWQGKIEEDNELLMVIKTHQRRIIELQQAIRDRHPYETPEIISLPIDTGIPEYLAWLDGATDTEQTETGGE